MRELYILEEESTETFFVLRDDNGMRYQLARTQLEPSLSDARSAAPETASEPAAEPSAELAAEPASATCCVQPSLCLFLICPMGLMMGCTSKAAQGVRTE